MDMKFVDRWWAMLGINKERPGAHPFQKQQNEYCANSARYYQFIQNRKSYL